MSFQIHPETRIGAVHLTIPNLEKSLAFYQQNLGFKLHRRENSIAYLGAGGEDLLVLHENPQARPLRRGQTGLYHFAVLTPSRLALAKSLQHLADTQTPVQGFADHNVSEAIYLPDNNGNGIEIYRDRPRSEWEFIDGTLKMGTEPLDLESILAELDTQDNAWAGLLPETVIGHIHLHVARLPETQAFYGGVLGFDLMVNYGHSALFMSAGGYHHHLGLNVWAGIGAPPPPTDSVGLKWYEVMLPDRAALESVLDRVKAAGLPIEEIFNGFLVLDPSQNGVLLRM